MKTRRAKIPFHFWTKEKFCEKYPLASGTHNAESFWTRYYSNFWHDYQTELKEYESLQDRIAQISG